MLELIRESFSLVNLPYTVLLLEESARTGSGGTAGPAEHQLDSPAE